MANPLKKAGEKVVREALKAPRAVTAKEAPSIKPAKEASSETMMPWRGWVGRAIQKAIGEERYQAMRQIVFFRADDPMDMNQMPFPNTKFDVTEDGSKKRMFRYPSPGSDAPVRIPKSHEKGTTNEDPYNVSYYTRDTARRNLDPANPHPELQAMKLALMDPNDPEVEEMKEALVPKSSPGNKGRFATGPTDFDSTGNRASMSANHESMNKSLDANMPDHLPYPEWYNRQDEVMAWYKERDLPVPWGEVKYGLVPTKARVARW